MKLILSILLISLVFKLSAQYTINQELKFIQHLVNQEEYEDAIYYMSNNLRGEYPMPIRDSLNYLNGWSRYALKDLNESSSFLLRVSSDSPFFLKSRFFAAYNYAYLGMTSHSDYILSQLSTNPRHTSLRNFEMAGNALLKRDLTGFRQIFNPIETLTDFAFYEEKQQFELYYDEINRHRNKSMVVGGILSTLIPGAGKIYAGKTGEGIASFLMITATGATAYENYRKLGIKNAKTILFGALFSVLYIGNIYGTVFTVKLSNEEFNHEINNKILFNMHIPLRNFFN